MVGYLHEIDEADHEEVTDYVDEDLDGEDGEEVLAGCDDRGRFYWGSLGFSMSVWDNFPRTWS